MNEIIASLSPLEKKVLPKIKHQDSIKEIASRTNLSEVEVMRACEFLSNKKIVVLKRETKTRYTVTEKGLKAIEQGLPEERFVKVIKTPKTIPQIQSEAKLDKNEVNASIGILKKEGVIQLGDKIRLLKEYNTNKRQILEKILKKEQVKVPEELIKRGLVEKKIVVNYNVELTKTGEKIQKEDLTKEYQEKLTSESLKTGAFKTQELRHYDVTSPVPAITYGRTHFVQDMINHIKEIWVSMGFKEMQGTITQTAFWDLDCLFVPQDHPAREMQDTFYLNKKGRLPDFWKRVAEVHETGGKTNSKGWQYKYDVNEAKKVLLRTHTTVLSAQTIHRLKEEDLPAKYFSVAKVYRNETLDWKHLFEFHQVEGIVVDHNLTFADLIGLQKEFYKKMGFEKIRFRPAYFPYTEPSAEVEVYHPEKKQWIELGGMGVIRPEVTIPLFNKEVTVLAWGLGMERLITDYYSITDLRELYDNDLNKLRTIKEHISNA